MKTWPKRWQDCKPYVSALVLRGYIAPDTYRTYMSEGIYLYMYELFIDGHKAAQKKTGRKT